jgi:hypothetical protein
MAAVNLVAGVLTGLNVVLMVGLILLGTSAGYVIFSALYNALREGRRHSKRAVRQGGYDAMSLPTPQDA